MSLSKERQEEYDKLNFRRGIGTAFDRLVIERKISDLLSADNRANQQTIEDLTAKAERLIGLLSVAKCPNCDGSGSVPVEGGDGGWEAEQCQWCFEREAALKESEAAK